MTLDDALKQAITHHQAGRLAEAEALYRAILKAAPDHAWANHNLGRIAMAFGKTEPGLPHLMAAVANAGHVPHLHLSLGEAFARLGRHDEASARFARALALKPDLAEECYHQGNALQLAGNPAGALEQYGLAIALRPGLAEAHNNMGTALFALGRHDEAIAAYTKALNIRPDFVDPHYNLGVLCAKTGRLRDAAEHYRKAVALRPDYAEAHNNLGGVLMEMGQAGEAEACHRRALELRPDYPGALYNLGCALNEQARFDDARHCYERALALDPKMAEPHNKLAGLFRMEGRYGETIASYRRVMEIEPDNVMAHRNLLAAILYDPAWTPEMQFAEHRAFEARHARPHYPQAVAFANPPDPDRRLRIGYLSSDLNGHPVGRNLIPVVEAHDRDRFELFFYAHVASSDSFSRRFHAQAAGWRGIIGMSDRQVADLIRADGIDILVSLAGRFDLNRPQVCAFRPAPIQISFHDPATSGLEAMDYLIADRVLVPRHGDERFTERPIRLPSFYLHDPIADAPPPGGLPMLVNGYPTFGSFNNPAKLSDETLALWARVLHRVPNSRLRLKYLDWMAAPLVSRRILAAMAANGIGPERLDLAAARDSAQSHLALYHDIDIALDPFPFNGSTTTFEALWMETPVVTLPGRVMVSRWAASIMAPLGLGELIAGSPDAYVDICEGLAADPDRLTRLRAGLRRRIEASPLCDARRRAGQIERAYRAVWRRWCIGRDGRP
ncbi:glycosyltransferase family 41 protein [Magnetospirillum sp. SS-4]|uniref:tetratricopeptide repeat protein n=1 Tax=Magnetospirillum sp. SS-4 TaxID=2681465 RepID=UPI00137C7A2E|nr:glycosyltransferase family 41 protein [Magnetospirillum sp. SS-4]CAA7625970.1 putative TPR repeat-containing protein [Magnetospirillum sp. SS-4]